MNLNKADEYFSLHLLGEEWRKQSAETRAAALAMAEADVTVELGGNAPDTEQLVGTAAVCEQAVYLLRNIENASDDTAHLAAESVDGIGSRQYRAGADVTISPRAKKFIAILRGSAGSVRLSRG